MSKNMPGSIPSNTLGVLGDIFQKTATGVFSHRELELFAQRKNPFGDDNIVFPQTGIDWLRVYRELGMESEFRTAVVAMDKAANDDTWWVPAVKGVTPNKIVAWFRKRGVSVYTYVDDLDKDVSKNDRDPANGSYAVCFARTIEANPELAGKSANMLAEEQIRGTTLTERLLLELGFFLQTGDHLDKQNITLCSGSRDSDGDVPRVDWGAASRELYVDCYSPDSRLDVLRARAVVSLPAEAPAQAG